MKLIYFFGNELKKKLNQSKLFLFFLFYFNFYLKPLKINLLQEEASFASREFFFAFK